MKVLLIEDEQKIADFVCTGLTRRGFHVTHCANGHAGHALGLRADVDIIVLDVMLPGRDGLSVLQEWRAAGVTTPVILLTARNELGDRISGFDLGADDYLAKPFFVEELVARMQALLRRTGTRPETLAVGALKLDCISRQLSNHGRSCELTAREFSLLAYLMRSPGQLFTRGQILEHVWGYDFDPSTNVVDVCIRRIRNKMQDLADHDPNAGAAIEAVRGAGYRFRSQACA
ncbi:two-component system OmpR family response regulator [Actimicrobium sp. GrIS 1.19]|uniref:response regulator transcription factor n=1 Tax=Actimicrobium sp. GrIS 1.19 TaxID=3071708 RepID=UPI002E025E80|nr:two-component system OmpR family response regulator [Actimicrobium sp. GrIS 1.19]